MDKREVKGKFKVDRREGKGKFKVDRREGGKYKVNGR